MLRQYLLLKHTHVHQIMLFVNGVMPAGSCRSVPHLPDVLQRLSIHHTVEFGGRGLGAGTARSGVGLGRVLPLLLVFEHLWVLDDGGGELRLGAGYSQTLPVDVLVDAVL